MATAEITLEQNQEQMKEMTIALIVTALRRRDFEEVLNIAKAIAPDFLNGTYSCEEITSQPVIGLII